jgi:uncharacterized protein (UPF0218 family)
MYRMLPAMSAELSQPLGPVLKAVPESLHDSQCVVTVGDRTTLVVAASGLEPHLAIVDFKTRRHTRLSAADRAALETVCADRVLRVRNPAGGITRELWDAVASTAEQRTRTRIEVDGEEDLATLAVLALCPDDSQVLYGQPGEGLVHMTLGPELRQRAKIFLDRMKEN